MIILNLGCGTKTSSKPEVINIDWSIHLRLKKNPFFKLLLPVLVSGDRLKRIKALPENILVHDLKKGIPFKTDSVDVVYHSHVLEHIDRSTVDWFLKEIKRVLKPGGIHRIVVPNLEKTCLDYLTHLKLCENEIIERKNHDNYVAPLIELSVKKEASGTSQQPPIRRFLENIFLGDARKRGETHQWLYDRFNLGSILETVGFREIVIQDFNTSLIPNWNVYSLDLGDKDKPYKPGSLYIEAIK